MDGVMCAGSPGKQVIMLLDGIEQCDHSDSRYPMGVEGKYYPSCLMAYLNRTHSYLNNLMGKEEVAEVWESFSLLSSDLGRLEREDFPSNIEFCSADHTAEYLCK